MLTLLLAGVAGSGIAEDYPVPAWATSRVTSAMCEGSRMHLVVTGVVTVAYEQVYAALMRTNILQDVARAYLRELPAGAKTNLTITPRREQGRYIVVWKDERAEVVDVWRWTGTNSFLGGFVIKGKRFFGPFETVMTILVQRTPGGQACFQADVLIYPHNGLIRFLFNNVFSVEDYFRDVLIEMSDEIKRICINLCKAPAAAPARETSR